MYVHDKETAMEYTESLIESPENIEIEAVVDQLYIEAGEQWQRIPYGDQDRFWEIVRGYDTTFPL